MKIQRTLVNATAEGTGTRNTDFGAGAGREFTAYLNVSAVSGTPTLDVKFQEYDAASDTWFDIPSAAFAQATTTTSERITFTTNSDRLRCVRVVGGTTPSFDYTVGLAGA